MKIRFLKDCYIEVCVGFDDEEEPMMEEEKIVEGETFEGEVLEGLDDEIAEIQFGDGSVAFVSKELFEVIEE
jgi:hypothetical protein